MTTTTAPTIPTEEATTDNTAAADGKATDTTNTGVPERPEWLPEKFQSPEDLAKAYGELESKLSATAEADKADADGGETTDAPAGGFDAVYAEAEKAIMDGGELTEDIYKKFENLGVNKNVVDAFVEGQMAAAERQQAQLYKSVGGEEAANSALQWAAENLSEDEKTAYNKIVDSGDHGQIQVALQGLVSRANAALADKRPNPITPHGSAPGAGDVFQSAEEVTAAMSDPRYKTSPTYREAVAAKLARSNVFN